MPRSMNGRLLLYQAETAQKTLQLEDYDFSQRHPVNITATITEVLALNSRSWSRSLSLRVDSAQMGLNAMCAAADPEVRE